MMYVKLQAIDTNTLYLFTSINKKRQHNAAIFMHQKNPIFHKPVSIKIKISKYPVGETIFVGDKNDFQCDLVEKIDYNDGFKVVVEKHDKCSMKCLNEENIKHRILNKNEVNTRSFGRYPDEKFTIGNDGDESRCSLVEKCDNGSRKYVNGNRSVGVKNGTHTGIWRKQENTVNGGTVYKKGISVKKCMRELKNNGIWRKQENAVNGGTKTVYKKGKFSKKGVHYGGCISAILKSLERKVDLDEAMRPWERSVSNKEISIILKEQWSWERALDIFQWFERKGCYEVNVIHYNIVFRILGKARRWDLIESLWEEMKKRNVTPVNSTYGTLIDVYSKGGLQMEAIGWLELMREQDMEPDEVTMGIVVQMYKKAREFEKAEHFFRKWALDRKPSCVDTGNAERAPERINGDVSSSRLSSYTYNTLIDTFGKAGQLKEASETFEKMLREGVLPTMVTFNTLIYMYGDHGRLGEINQLFRKMEELHCQPDSRTYNILIYIHAKHDDIETAEKYFTKMKEGSLEPDLVSYRTLLYAFSVRQMVSRAEKVISEMDEKGLKIDGFTQPALTRMYIEAGLIEKAWAWYTRFHLKGKMSSDSYAANIDAFGVRGLVLEAEKVFMSCRQGRTPSVLEFNVMIKAYGLSKRYDEACKLFDSMIEYNVVPDKCTFNSLIQILANANLPDLAVTYVKKMLKAGLVNDCIAYCSVISSFAKLGELDKAEKIFTEMVGYNVPPDVIVYGVLINAFAENGSVEKALDYVQYMAEAGIPVNTVICNSLIKLYTKVGNLTEAERIYKKLRSFEDGPSAYSSNCMIDLYSRRCMVQQAEDIFENLKRKGDANEFSYAMMLCMYKRLGRYQEAIRIARKMKELGILTVLLSYNQVLDVYALAGRFKEAYRTFEEMIQRSLRPDDSTFKSLGSVLVKCGVSESAVSELDKTRRKDPERALQTWFSTLTCVVCVDNDEKCNES